MGLLIECPECKTRNSSKPYKCGECRECRNNKPCKKSRPCKKCGFALAKFSGRVYWIDYLIDGERRRERIGPSKESAEQRLREVLSARAEGRYIQKSPDVLTRFKELAAWYLDLPEVQAKRSYDRDKRSLKNLLPFFGDRLLKDITPGLVEAYRRKRLTEYSGRTPEYLTKPATINRELACFKTIFNKALREGRAGRNPVQGVKQLKENNERDRLLSPEEFTRLLAACPEYLRPILKLAYYTGMRKSEILNLTWGKVDLKEGFIRLRPEDTKTQEKRLVPLSQEMIEMFKAMPRGLPGVKVFTRLGKPINSIREVFEAACKRAQITDFTFHDFRHTAINNWRLQGHDYFRIMAATGHKTLNVFKRYNTVSKEELMALVGGSK
jgi:integrase